MMRGIWEAFVARLTRNMDADEDDESRFVPSPLDLSIREAHGGQDVSVERELSKIREEAEEIEENERKSQ
jgi:hypothetical protein